MLFSIQITNVDRKLLLLKFHALQRYKTVPIAAVETKFKLTHGGRVEQIILFLIGGIELNILVPTVCYKYSSFA